MKYLLTIVLLGCLAIACQKEIGFGNGSGATQTTSVRCTSCSYLPVCDSTKLSYIDSSASGIDTIASTLAILGDTTINGRKFTRVSPSAIFSQGLLYNCDITVFTSRCQTWDWILIHYCNQLVYLQVLLPFLLIFKPLF
jgi:hypothetical protein